MPDAETVPEDSGGSKVVVVPSERSSRRPPSRPSRRARRNGVAKLSPVTVAAEAVFATALDAATVVKSVDVANCTR